MCISPQGAWLQVGLRLSLLFSFLGSLSLLSLLSLFTVLPGTTHFLYLLLCLYSSYYFSFGLLFLLLYIHSLNTFLYFPRPNILE